MKVILVHPWIPTIERQTVPPLGLLCLAAFLRQKYPSVSVSIVDAQLEELPAQALADRVIAQAPDLVGIYSIVNNRNAVHDLAAALKPQTPCIVVGGPYASSCHEQLLADSNIDYAVIGEGEIPLLKLVEALAAGRAPEGVPRLVRRGATPVKIDPGADTITNLDELPRPAFDLVHVPDYFRYSSSLGILVPTHKTWMVYSSRGCPYSCTFCHAHFGRRHRQRSVTAFVDELAWLQAAYGVEHFDILDDCFNITERRVLEFCAEVKRRGLRIRFSFPNGLRLDRLSEPSLDALGEAGLFYFGAPIESASSRIRELMNKSLDIAKAEKALAYARTKGLLASGFFMIGYPGETEEEIRATIDYALKAPLICANFNITCAYPGTQLFDSLAEPDRARLLARLASREQFHFHRSANFSQVGDARLLALYRSAYLRFFLRPKVIVGLLRRLNFPSLARAAGVALRRNTAPH